MPDTAEMKIAAERFTRQGLAVRSCGSFTAVAAVTTAVQAQDDQAARLGIRARIEGATAADVVAALDIDRLLVRTWLMRGTIHLVAAADLRWLVRLIGPTVARRYRTRWQSMGLTDEVLGRTVALLPEILAGGPGTRHEIVAALRAHGVGLDQADPQVPTHVILHASTAGLLCRGPDSGRERTFVLTADWLPSAAAGPSGDEALAELARRYFAAYSPATAADFTAWSELSSRQAINLIRDELAPADVGGTAGYRLGEVEPVPGVRLAPAFDNYVIGYRDRAALLAADHHLHVYQGGMIRPTVLVDGRIVGTWAVGRLGLSVSLFAAQARRVRDGIEAEAADIGRFLGRDCPLQIHQPE